MVVTGIPETPVKAGDTISYTVEVEANGADTTGWYVLIRDALKAEINNSESYEEKVELSDNKVTVTYSIPKDFYISSAQYHISFVLTDGKQDEYGNDNILAQEFSKSINTKKTLENSIDFQLKGLVTGTEYPFSITWTNTVDYDIKDFATSIWTEIYDKQGEAYGAKPTYKITKYPEGAKVVKQGEGSAEVENITIPKGGNVTVSGTVSYPAEGISAQLHFDEIINGEFISQASTTGFSVGASTGGNGNTSQQPGTETSGNTAKDKATGITVCGLTMPIPEGFSTNLKLYHQNTKGVLEAVNISVKDSNVSFEAKSFSPYVLVDMGAKVANTSTNVKSPKTGDTSSMMLYLMLALAAMGSIGFAAKRRMNG